MSTVVYKYQLAEEGITQVDLPEDAQILSVIKQADVLVMYARVAYPFTDTVARFIQSVGTGRLAELHERGRFIQTVQVGAYVWHFFEITAEPSDQVAPDSRGAYRDDLYATLRRNGAPFEPAVEDRMFIRAIAAIGGEIPWHDLKGIRTAARMLGGLETYDSVKVDDAMETLGRHAGSDLVDEPPPSIRATPFTGKAEPEPVVPAGRLEAARLALHRPSSMRWAMGSSIYHLALAWLDGNNPTEPTEPSEPGPDGSTAINDGYLTVAEVRMLEIGAPGLARRLSNLVEVAAGVVNDTAPSEAALRRLTEAMVYATGDTEPTELGPDGVGA